MDLSDVVVEFGDQVADKRFTRGDIGLKETRSIQQMAKNGIPSFIVSFKTHFDTVVHKQIVTIDGTGTVILQHGGEHITRFRLGGCNELCEVDCS